MAAVLLPLLVLPFAVVVLTSGIWIPLWIYRRDSRMNGAFDALAFALGAVREQNTLRVPGLDHGAEVHLHAAGKNDPWILEVALPGRGTLPSATILFRTERWRDRMGKRASVNREVQTGDEAFDRAVYIESDAPDEVIEALLRDPDRRRAVLRIVGAGFRLLVDGSRCLLSATRPRPGPEHFDVSTVRAVADALAVVAPGPPAPATVPRPLFPGSVESLSAVVVLAAIVLGIASTYAVSLAAGAFPPLASDLYYVALPTAAGLLLAAVPMTALFVRGRSTSLRALGWLLLAGLVIVPCSTVAAFLVTNGALDPSAPVRYRTRISSRWEKHGKGGDHYLVRVAPLRAGEGELEVEVDKVKYARLADAMPIVVVIGRGALGWAWVRGIEPRGPSLNAGR